MAEAHSEIGDLDGVQWDPSKDDFVLPTDPIPDEIAADIPELRAGLDREQFDRMVGPEKFRGALAKVTAYYARVRGVDAIALDVNDPGYIEACEVVYRRLMDGPGRHLLPYLSNRDLVDLWIVAAFAVPYFHGVANEIKAKRAAARTAARGPGQQAEGEGASDGN